MVSLRILVFFAKDVKYIKNINKQIQNNSKQIK